jgi:cell division protein FtsN
MISSRLADAADALLVEVVAIVLRSFEYQYHKLLLLRVSWVPARVSRFPKPSWHFVAPRIFEKGMTPLQAAPSSASQHHRSHGEERSTISQGSEEQRQRGLASQTLQVTQVTQVRSAPKLKTSTYPGERERELGTSEFKVFKSRTNLFKIPFKRRSAKATFCNLQMKAVMLCAPPAF